MFVLYLSILLLTEISWSIEGALTFTQRPAKTVYFRKGQDAVLKWDYSADNKSAELQYIIWYAGLNPLMFEDRSGTFQFSPAIPQAYVGRVERIKPATLVIKSLTYEDAGTYSCNLQGVPGVSGATSYITLIVTDELVVTTTDGTVDKPAELEWAALAGAEYYVVQISGSDIYDDVTVVTQTSLEFHYHTLVMTRPDGEPEQTTICANVFALKKNKVIGRTQTCLQLTIRRPSGLCCFG